MRNRALPEIGDQRIIDVESVIERNGDGGRLYTIIGSDTERAGEGFIIMQAEPPRCKKGDRVRLELTVGGSAGRFWKILGKVAG